MPYDELYVMLMLMRSETNAVDCDDPVVALACLDEEAEAYKECPAACREDAKTDEDGKPVKSGDLEVTAKSAPSTKVLKSGTSDLDTLTFKTSEEVEITKITLERYGYSKEDQITWIWLEDQDGNVIADSKSLSKDKVTLNLKKNYRTVDGKLEATIVVTTSGADGTVGFKVTNVESTAKNVNLDDYNPYTYEVIGYNASVVTLELKGNDKTYNYEEGTSYEIGRLKVSAGNSDLLVKGFTLNNAGKVDMKESLDQLTVKVDWNEVKAKYSVNKDDELVVTFNSDVEIAMNKKATFVLSASFKDFDDYGESVQYYVDEDADFNAVEKKNGTRVEITNAAKKENVTTYTFNGGKIKLSNKKLGNVDAAQGSEWIVVAEGDVTISEPISKIEFNIEASWSGAQYIKNMYFVVNGDEYDHKSISESNGTYTISFENISIEESGKIQFKMDVKDPTEGISGSPVINFNTSFNGTTLTTNGSAKYDNVSKQYVKSGDVAGSISFSKVTIQAAKAALENNLTKKVEFIQNETNRKVVFEGTYTAKKGGDIDLNKFFVSWTPFTGKNKATFYLFIDWEEVADTDVINTGSDVKTVNAESFSDIRVKAGESVKVKVEAEIEAYGTGETNNTLALFLYGTDMSGNEDTGRGTDDLVEIEIKAKGSVTIPSDNQSKTALLKASNVNVASFRVKPSNGNEWITLEELVLSGNVELTGIKVNAGTEKDVEWTIADADDASRNVAAGDFVYDLSEEIPADWLVIDVIYKNKEAKDVKIIVKSVNGKKFNNEYSKYLVNSLVKFTKQSWSKESTLTVSVEHEDDSYSIPTLFIYANGAVVKTGSDVKDGNSFTIERIAKDQTIDKIAYYIDGVENCPITDKTAEPTAANECTVILDNVSYPDFFKIGGNEIIIPAI